ncbi:MAG TPA: LPS export ABC transporter periplasmic protein LptC [Candidatus Elarobacter sp.]|jgi:lipopolysaccharide export system protein LptA
MRRACAVLAVALLGAAPASPPGLPTTRIAGPYYVVETSSLRYNTDSGAFVADAPVKVTKQRLDAAGERAEGNVKAGTATLHGSVQVHDGGGPSSPRGKSAPPATLTCDQLEVDGKRELYHAEGRARYESGERTATARTMILDRKHKTLHLEGDVVMTQGDSTARAQVVDMDLASGRTVSTGAPVTLSRPASPAP